MPPSLFRLVLDTNILVRAFINFASDSGRIVRICEQRRAVPLLSGPVLREYRFILTDSKLCARYPQLDRPEVAVAVERLVYVSDMYRRVGARFAYPRDPKDSHLIELAIVGGATHLISTDDDLLALPDGRNEAARRFRQRLPSIRVLQPRNFSAALSGRSRPGLSRRRHALRPAESGTNRPETRNVALEHVFYCTPGKG